MESNENDHEQKINEINEEINNLTKTALDRKLIEKKQAYDFLRKIHNLINDDPDEFRLTACSWVLNSENNKELDGLRRQYKYLAELVIKKVGKEKQNLEGFVSARNWIENEVYFDILISTDYQEPYLNSILHTLFHPISENVANQSAYFSYMVYFGVPLYIYVAKSNEYCLLDENSEEYSYLKLRGKYYESSSGYSMPDWAEYIFINIDHVDWHFKLDNDTSTPENENDARIKLRKAYRNIIGLTDKANPNKLISTKSRLYKIMESVLVRYYGSQFDPFDSDTWPKQKNVVEWLKFEYGLSEREAIAIDIVTRPDEARRK